MHEPTFEEVLEAILEKDPRYHRDAYFFLREALDHTQKMIVKENRGGSHHVTGQELLAGIRDYALAEFGPMSLTVLEEWGVHNCQDFGELVFNMVDAGVLAKTETDSREDFQGGYDFQTAFRDPFLPRSKRPQAVPDPKPTQG